MSTVLKDLVHHNSWATSRLIEFCDGLKPEQLEWTVAGSYGDIRATLEHLVDSEMAYFRLVTGIDVVPSDGVTSGLPIDQIRQWFATLAPHWESFLQEQTDVDHRFTASSESGRRFTFTHGVVLAQIFNHANVHREQVCNILTVHGITPPDVDAWSYAFAMGRGGPAMDEETL